MTRVDGDSIEEFTKLLQPVIFLNDDQNLSTTRKSTVVVAESGAGRLTRFSLRDGVLCDRTNEPLPATVAVPFCAPDGLCLGEEGGRWVADSINKRVFRVQDGVITDEYYLDQYVLACVLGDRDRRSLYVCVTDAWHKSDTREEPTGRILRLRVAIPGVGRPSDHVRQPEPGTTMTEAG